MADKRKKMVVMLEQSAALPQRRKPEPLIRTFTVWAYTKQQATKAVKDAGHAGRVAGVIVNG